MKYLKFYYYFVLFIAQFLVTDELVAWIIQLFLWIPLLADIGIFIAERIDD